MYYRTGQLPAIGDRIKVSDIRLWLVLDTLCEVIRVTPQGCIYVNNGQGTLFETGSFDFVHDQFVRPRAPVDSYLTGQLPMVGDLIRAIAADGVFALGAECVVLTVNKDGVCVKFGLDSRTAIDPRKFSFVHDKNGQYRGPFVAAGPGDRPEYPPVDWSKPLELVRGGKVEVLKLYDTGIVACAVHESSGHIWTEIWQSDGLLRNGSLIVADRPGLRIVNTKEKPFVFTSGPLTITAHRDMGEVCGVRLRLHTTEDDRNHFEATSHYLGTYVLPPNPEFKKP